MLPAPGPTNATGAPAEEAKAASSSDTNLGSMKTDRRRKRLEAEAQLRAGTGLLDDRQIHQEEERLTQYVASARPALQP